MYQARHVAARRCLPLFALAALVVTAVAPEPVRGQAGKKVYLTFDDGPQPGTAEVLDVLKEFGAPATFFVTGANVTSLPGGKAKQEELARRIIAEGHALGNHAYKHYPATKKDYEKEYGNLDTATQKAAFRKNLDDNLAHFRGLLGAPFAFPVARLPGDGRFTKAYVDEVKAMGMTHVDWQFEFAPNGEFAWVPVTDWQGVSGVAASGAGLPAGGSIVLFHDRHWKAGNKALFKAALKKLKDAGYTFAR